MVNQTEYHPYCQDPELTAFCADHGIAVEAYAPFASGAFGLLKDPVIVDVAKQAGCTTGQAILRWHLQQGRVVLPKSTNPNPFAQNLDLFGFELSEEQMTRITGLSPDGALTDDGGSESIL